MITLKTRTIWLVAACVLPLGACGPSGPSGDPGPAARPAADSPAAASAAPGDGQLAIPADADPDTRKYYTSENAIAACMVKRGFRYTPDPGPDWSDGGFSAVDGQDYALGKKYREKYGFGAYAAAVYPDDPAVPRNEDEQSRPDPDAAYLASLTPAQRKAYDTALGRPDVIVKDGAKKMVDHQDGCSEEGRLKAYGPVKSQAEQEQENARQEERAKDDAQALNGDPQLISLAQRYASCLRDAGIPVSTTQPTGMSDMVKFQQYANLPADGSAQKMSRNEALPRLTQEIGLALKDLECGKAFRAAYFPKFKQHPNGGGQG